ncbi:putative LacX protein [Listeria floridensis FSL S10-1187]|uniref:LacX protein n=1 Tax=Listeria floridensis FSL S10-1187 TaxID=1265817 RepID=A0ABP3B097_9LIST|nr:aldose 1-epimerase family protein [Listeria floridensis]EUJ33317.1 putative LacX protein [Listeria floridensis FSL S10-1187]
MIRLENDTLLVEIAEAGAELSRIYNKTTKLDYLWNADSKFWGRHAPVLFPTVGRLIDDTYYVDGEAFHLPQHGFARDRDFSVVELVQDRAVLELKADDKSKLVYPYNFRLAISYTLVDDQVRVEYQVENTDDKRIYFSIGAHPAFNVPLTEGTAFEDYYLDFGGKEKLDTLLLDGPYRSGKLKSLADKKAETLALNYPLFEGDALIFEGLNHNEIAIRSKKHPHFVKVRFPEFPFVGVWTAGPGTPFLCIEPWFGIADGVGSPVELRDKAAIEQLEPEAIFTAEYNIQIG